MGALGELNSGLAAEAWALPRYLPSVITIDFEEIVKIIFFEWITIRSPRDLTRPSPGEAAGLRTPAASHRPLPYFGYVRWVKFKLFVHYSFIIRSLFALIRALCKRSHPKDMLRYLGATFGSLGSILGSLEAILGALEGILGGLGGLLESSWGILGWSWRILGCS